MTDVKIRNTPVERWAIATHLAVQFLDEFPDKMGIHDGVAYVRGSDPTYYVYRTKTQVIVVGND